MSTPNASLPLLKPIPSTTYSNLAATSTFLPPTLLVLTLTPPRHVLQPVWVQLSDEASTVTNDTYAIAVERTTDDYPSTEAAVLRESELQIALTFAVIVSLRNDI